jgi:hypothetical protein
MVVYGSCPRGFRPSLEQAAWRRKAVLRLLKDGCTPPQIAAAMRPVVNEGTIRRDLHELGVRWVRRINRIAADPPPVDWLHPPVVQDDPADRAAAALRHFLAEMEAARGVPAHAHDLLEARLDGDQGWETWWREHIRELRQIADDLERLHADSGFLRATALGREPPGRSERVHEDGHGVRGIVQPVVRVVHEACGSRGLSGDVEDDEDHERPADNLPEHPSTVTLQWPSVDRVHA